MFTMMRDSRGVWLSLLATLVFAAGCATAGTQGKASDDEKKKPVDHYNVPKSKLAIEGYDPVAYFPEGGKKPKKGKKEHELVLDGVKYRFVSKKNLEAFEKNPQKYMPAYGGWCAFAMADGEKVSVNPKAYRVTDGRLYLFYTSFFTDTRKSWKKNEAKLANDADGHWKKIAGEEPRKGGKKAGAN